MTPLSANINSTLKAALKDAVISTRPDRHKTQQEKYILERRSCDIGESQSYDLNVKWHKRIRAVGTSSSGLDLAFQHLLSLEASLCSHDDASENKTHLCFCLLPPQFILHRARKFS